MSDLTPVIQCALLTSCLLGCTNDVALRDDSAENAASGPVYVNPDQDLQQALDDAAAATEDRTLILKPGVYQTAETRFCLLAITARHEGVTIQGQDGAVLSARSPVDPETATVSHVIYCGDGLSDRTTIRDLTITGAKGMATNGGVPRENYGFRVLKHGLFFYMDGGAVKVFGKSAPVFEGVDFVENETNLCGGAVSIEQQGYRENSVTFRNCRFLRNRCPATGSAVDVLEGSSVRLDNCLFVENIANYGMTEVREKYQLSYNAEHGSGALTVFPGAHAWVSGCTFVGNWNAVDDRGVSSKFQNTIFVNNNASDGSRPGHPYEVDITNAAEVRGCVFHSEHPDLQGTVSADHNLLNADDPQFDQHYVPTNPQYRDAGFRP